MYNSNSLLNINCPLCKNNNYNIWAKDNGYSAVKCNSCGLIYVNPRPNDKFVIEGAKTGIHINSHHNRNAIAHRIKSNIFRYKKLMKTLFSDVWQRNNAISWLDVGAGYGEFVEAITMLAPAGSNVLGIDPMTPKVQDAKSRGLNMKECMLDDLNQKFEFISLVNVFSHIPDFHSFLRDIKKVLVNNGEFFLETGNIGDLSSVSEVTEELDLPDHLIFAGEKNIVRFLEEADFEIIQIIRRRKDGFWNFFKSVVKKIIGRNISLALPYTSKCRTILIRAKLK